MKILYTLREFIRKLFRWAGLDISRSHARPKDIATQFRPVGRMEFVLEDLKKRGLTCRSIIDVGANEGKWSKLASKIFPAAKLYLIEPQVEMKPHLEKLCTQYKQATYFLAGASATKGEAILTIWDDLQGSSLLPSANEQLLKSGKQRQINLIAIDDLIASGKIDLPDLIKLDIQGYELEALKGAEKTFGFTEVYILEVSLFPWSDLDKEIPIFADVVKFMADRGYVVYDFAGFLRRPLDGALGQCDICFVREKGFLRESKMW
jgi:FkbM family methyltransferase